MRASKFEFRLRGLILTLFVILGFWAPWLQTLDLGKRISLLEWLALEISRLGPVVPSIDEDEGPIPDRVANGILHNFSQPVLIGQRG